MPLRPSSIGHSAPQLSWLGESSPRSIPNASPRCKHPVAKSTAGRQQLAAGSRQVRRAFESWAEGDERRSTVRVFKGSGVQEERTTIGASRVRVFRGTEPSRQLAGRSEQQTTGKSVREFDGSRVREFRGRQDTAGSGQQARPRAFGSSRVRGFGCSKGRDAAGGQQGAADE